MHTTGKRLLAVILAALMLFTAVPMGALAAITQNTPEYNKEILNALTGLVGSETEAQDYYEVLQNYGLLDEDGNAVESWSIMMDGEEITADELREILSGDYDPDKHIYVDGTFVTLSDVKYSDKGSVNSSLSSSSRKRSAVPSDPSLDADTKPVQDMPSGALPTGYT